MKRTVVGHGKSYKDPEMARILSQFTKDRGEITDFPIPRSIIDREVLDAFMLERSERVLGIRARPWDPTGPTIGVRTCNTSLENAGPFAEFVHSIIAHFYSPAAAAAVEEHYKVTLNATWRLTVKLYPSVSELCEALGNGPYSVSIPCPAVRIGFYLPIGSANEELTVNDATAGSLNGGSSRVPVLRQGGDGNPRVSVLPPSLMKTLAVTCNTAPPSRGIDRNMRGAIAAFTLTYAPMEQLDISHMYSSILAPNGAAQCVTTRASVTDVHIAPNTRKEIRNGRLVRVPVQNLTQAEPPSAPSAAITMTAASTINTGVIFKEDDE